LNALVAPVRTSTQTQMELDLEFFTIKVKSLERERCKITQRGKLSEEEDVRLDEIDTELAFWFDCIDNVYNSYEEEYEEDDTQV
jgi:hypothetical protein